MYRVYCDGNVLYSPLMDGYAIFDAKVDQEINKTGSFVFSIYPEHPYFTALKKLKSVITVYQDGKTEPIFRGRILNDEQGFYNEKRITCEGELAFLLDSIQRPYSFENKTVQEVFAYLVGKHNEQVDDVHGFKVGNVSFDNAGGLTFCDTNYHNTWDCLNQNLLEKYGGYLRTRHENGITYLDYFKEPEATLNQPVLFGKNLLDIQQTVKGDEIATAIIPLGAKLIDGEGLETDERLTIENINRGKDYICDEEAVEQYGKIFKAEIFDDITDVQTLYTKGRERLSEMVDLSVSIELSAVDLAALNTDIDAFTIGSKVKIKSMPHGIDEEMTVTKLSVDLMDPTGGKLTLGMNYRTFTEQTGAAQAEIAAIAEKSATATPVTQSEVSGMITNTCYTKAQTCRKITLSENTGNGVLATVKTTINNDEKIVIVAITDSDHHWYCGLLFLTDHISAPIRLGGDLVCAPDGSNGLSVSGGTGPFAFNFYV